MTHCPKKANAIHKRYVERLKLINKEEFLHNLGAYILWQMDNKAASKLVTFMLNFTPEALEEMEAWKKAAQAEMKQRWKEYCDDRSDIANSSPVRIE